MTSGPFSSAAAPSWMKKSRTQGNSITSSLSCLKGTPSTWLDTTEEVAPYGMLMLPLRDKQALVIPTKGAPELKTTPVNPPFATADIFNMKATLGSDQVLTGHADLTARGDLELVLRAGFHLTPEADWTKLWTKRRLSARLQRRRRQHRKPTIQTIHRSPSTLATTTRKRTTEGAMASRSPLRSPRSGSALAKTIPNPKSQSSSVLLELAITAPPSSCPRATSLPSRPMRTFKLPLPSTVNLLPWKTVRSTPNDISR